MFLNKIFKEAPRINIKGLALHSEDVSKGYLFFAIDGIKYDGHTFIEQAIQNGAVAIVYSKPIEHKRKKIVYIQAENVKKVMDYVIKVFYEDITRLMYMVGITGTSGKGSIAQLLYQLNESIEKSAMIGSNGITYAQHYEASNILQLDMLQIHDTFYQMHKHEVQFVAIEAPVQLISTGRTEGIHFDLIVHTNITPHHLEIYKTKEQYVEAKLALFKDRKVLLNMDDPYFEILNSQSKDSYTYGKSINADYRISSIHIQKDCTDFVLEHQEMRYEIHTALLGEHNVYNLVAAIAALHIKGVKLDVIVKNIENITQIEGRLTKVSEEKYNVFVDKSTTLDSLEKILIFAKEITPVQQRLIVVTGSEENVDANKRLKIGEILDRYSDQIILTENDNGNEDVKEMFYQIKKGIKNTITLTVESRKTAIQIAVNNANLHDTILVLGKGNEMWIKRSEGKQKYLGDDVIVKKCIQEKEQENELQ